MARYAPGGLNVNIKLPNGATYQLRAGDVIRFWHGNAEERAGTVIRYLTFPDHVVVQSKGYPCGITVDSAHFVRLVRRGRGPAMSEAMERVL